MPTKTTARVKPDDDGLDQFASDFHAGKLPSVGPHAGELATNSNPKPERNVPGVQRVPQVKSSEIPRYGQPSDSKLDQAEQVCLRLYRGEDIAASDLQSLNDEFGWDRIRLDREKRRIGSIVAKREAAGTPAELEAAMDKAENDQEAADAQIPTLDKQIRELMNKRDRLELAARNSKADVDNRSKLVAELRGAAPKRIKEVHAQMIGLLKSSQLNLDRLALQSAIRSIDGLKPDFTDEQIRLAKDCLPNNGAGIVTPDPTRPDDWDSNVTKNLVTKKSGSSSNPHPGNQSFRLPTINRTAWVNFVAKEIPKRRLELVAQLEPIENEFATRKAEIDSYLDFYVPQ